MDRAAHSRLRTEKRIPHGWECGILAVLLAMLAAAPAAAQLGQEIPHPEYYLATQAFYGGDYRDAERGLRIETRRGVRTTQARWIDAICYHAMLGEVLYHQGRNAEALAEFDQACQVLLAYPNWLLQVKFQQPPRADAARNRRPPPWGRSERGATLGQFPATEQIFIGELTPARVLREGGAYQPPMLWRVNAAEIVRASALAIRRRGELLGPLAVHDPITKELSNVLARGNLSPANHWSIAWIDLLRGVTQAGIGNFGEADTLLTRAVMIDGQFDHPLTCVALLEQGRLAMARGDGRRAAQLLVEASLSAYYYENWDVVTESLWLGSLNHPASNSGGVYPPLEAAVAWAQLNRLQHIATRLRLARADGLMSIGQPDAAAVLIDEASRRMGEMNRGLPGVYLQYLQADLQLQRGRIGPGSEMLLRAIAAQAAVSLRNFQIGRTNDMFDGQMISSRIAVDLYRALLADPRPADWTTHPLDATASLQLPHAAAFDRWFLAAIDRKDNLLAFEVAEQAKRRRFLASLPLGGRLLALRNVLEAPQDTLSRDTSLQRQQLFALFPEYQQLADAGTRMYELLRAGPVLAADSSQAKSLTEQYSAWDKNVAQRDLMLAQLAPARVAANIEFPPLIVPTDLQKTLGQGDALVLFHGAGGDLWGILLTSGNAHAWQLKDVRRVRAGVGDFLQSIGSSGANRSLSIAEISSNDWRELAAESYAAVFAGARLDIAKTQSLTIVPDDVLWHLPFDALISDRADLDTTLADHLEIRYGPTAALAISRSRPLRRPQHMGIVANNIQLGANDAETADQLAKFSQAVDHSLRIPTPLPNPARLVVSLLDGLIALDEVGGDRMSMVRWLPMPRGRGAADADAAAWGTLPFGGPEHVVITGYAATPELSARTNRRGAAADAPPGNEVFLNLCGMLANGARTVLLSRWQTGGRTNLELAREYAQELPQMPATKAWERARLLAREATLDARNEPRIKGTDDGDTMTTTDHPFFWAGYLLVDTGPRPEPLPEDSPDGVPPILPPQEKQDKRDIIGEATPKTAPQMSPPAAPADKDPSDTEDPPAASQSEANPEQTNKSDAREMK